MNSSLRRTISNHLARRPLVLAMGLVAGSWAQAGDRMGINFTDLSDSSDHLAPAESAGTRELAQANWNNVNGRSGSQTGLIDDQGTSEGAVSVSWGCGNTWRTTSGTSTPDQKLVKGYLDDTNNSPDPGPHVQVSGIPYPVYDVVLYLSSDTPNSHDYGAYYLTDDLGTEISARVFGGEIRTFAGAYQQIPSDSTNPALADPGGNYILFEGLTQHAFHVNGERTSVSRASLAAIQIVQSLGPRIRSFTADPPTVDPGEPCRLQWSVTNAVSLTLNGMDVTELTEIWMSPTEATTYSLIAANAEGSRTSQVTVAVRDLRPVIDHFVADPATVDLGNACILRWSESNATHLVLNGADVTDSTEYQVVPETDTSYQLIASNSYGAATASVSVVVVNGSDHPVISEFMARNSTSLEDEDGNSSDWIEIHNPTPGPIDLGGYALTDDATLAERWIFPSVVVPAQGYLLVFASGKTYPLHASFRLRGAGEFLALLDPEGRVLQAFSPAFPPQDPDVSYGILGSDPARTLYMGAPTPGSPNLLVPPPAQPVTFSLPDQTFSSGALLLTLGTITPDGRIRYTTDGSAPSPTHGLLYLSPISITNSAVVRAVAYSDTRSAGSVGVGHYIKLGEDVQAFNSPLPIMILDNFGAGSIPNKGFNQTMSGIIQVPRQGAAFMLFDRASDGIARINAGPALASRAGIRVRGSYSSTFARPPYSVEAWDGADQDVAIAPLGMPPESDWILYRPHEGYDFTLIDNTWIFELSNELGHYAARTRFVEGFVHTDGGELTLADHTGVYALTEKVKRDPNRIDIERFAADGSSGGWLLGINRLDPIPIGGEGEPQCFHTAGANRVQETPPNSSGQGDDEPRQGNAFINFEHPDGYDILPAQRTAIEEWFVPFENALWSPDYRDPDVGYRRYLDTADFIDYYILHNLSKNGDGMLLSMWLYLEHPGAKLKMGPVWDYDLSAYGGDPTSNLRHHGDRLWYGRMFTDIDFAQEYIDRWQMHRRGVLANTNLVAIVDRQAAEITAPVAVAHGVSNWAGSLANMKNWVSARGDAIDAQFVPAPGFNHPGGAVSTGFEVTLTTQRGEIYYTLDGTDPRAPGGSLSASAIFYPSGSALGIVDITQVKTRARDGDQWSGPVDRAFYPDAVAATSENLVISEIHYHPGPLETHELAGGVTDNSDFEFLELLNIGSQPLLLDGVAFTNGVLFDFTTGTLGYLAPGDAALIVRNPDTFGVRYPGVSADRIAGRFAEDSQLNNAGEQLSLVGPFGALREFAYDDVAPWPTAPDGGGRSLTLIAPLTNPDPADPSNWRSSHSLEGSPGDLDALSFSAWKVLHGVLSDTQDDDADGLIAFAEYAHGTDPATPDAEDAALRLRIGPHEVPGELGSYLFAQFTHDLVADDASFEIERTVDLTRGPWLGGADIVDYVGEQIRADGTAIRSYRTRLPAAAFTNLHLRLHIQPRFSTP